MSPKLNKISQKKYGSTLFAIIFGMIAVLGFMSILSPTPDVVTPETADGFNSQGTYTGYLFKIVAVTLTMIVVLIVGLRIYKKQLSVTGTKNFSIHILGKHYINNKQYLLKVFVEDKYMLLGVSDSSINFISELDGPAEGSDGESKNFGTILDLETNQESKV